MCSNSEQQPHPGLAFPAGVAGVFLIPSDAYTLTPVYDELYGIAQWLRDESARWKQRGNEVAEGRCAIASMLHCFLTLEAYINTYSALAVRLPNSPISVGNLDRLNMLPPDTKWLLFPLLFVGRPVFDAAREPFQSFAKLKSMRDNFIVHHKPQLRKEVTVDTSAAEGQPSMVVRGLAIPHTGLADWQEPSCNAEGARWACNLVGQMVSHLTEEVKAAGTGPMPPPHVTDFDSASGPIPKLAAVSVVVRQR